MRKILVLAVSVLLSISTVSCESSEERKIRLEREENERIELEILEEAKRVEREIQLEKDRIERERVEAEEARKQAIEDEQRIKAQKEYDEYINNSLRTGATPYSRYYGNNSTCKEYGCSEIKVRTPQSSDVIVLIKNRDEKVVRHAYIKGGDSFVFSMPNGSYQTFFYYGRGWNPNKNLKDNIRGAFTDDIIYSKDDYQFLDNVQLEYELILQQDGNFSTRPSSVEEVF